MEPKVDDIQVLNDSTLLVFSSGLYLVNLNEQGKGWDAGKVMSATKTDYKKVAAAFISVALVGALTGFVYPILIPNSNTYFTFAIDVSSNNLYSNISSNVFQDNNEFYFGSANKLERYKLNGTYLWSQPANENITSRSHLFKIDHKLCQINFGHALNYGIPKRYGKPFLATYDLATGQQLSIKMLENNKDFVIDYIIQDKRVYLLYKNSIEMHELEGYNFVLRKKTTTASHTKMQCFVPENLHLKKDNSFTSISHEQRANFVYNEDGELLQLDNDFLIAGKIEKDNIFSEYLNTKHYQFIGNDHTAYVLEKSSNIPISTLQASRFSNKVGTRLYSPYKEKLREIDISRFLKEKE